MLVLAPTSESGDSGIVASLDVGAKTRILRTSYLRIDVEVAERDGDEVKMDKPRKSG